jgi:hypothetical protein
MVVLTAAFWWGVEGYALFEGGHARSQIADGLLRFSLLVLTPAFVLIWLAAAWLRRRVGETGYWQLLGLVAMIWAGAILVTRMMLR